MIFRLITTDEDGNIEMDTVFGISEHFARQGRNEATVAQIAKWQSFCVSGDILLVNAAVIVACNDDSKADSIQSKLIPTATIAPLVLTVLDKPLDKPTKPVKPTKPRRGKK